MQGPPVKSLVPPGKCQFLEDPIQVPLIERTQISPTSSLLRYGLPDSSQPLNLSTCACILATAEIDGEQIARKYTPISTNADIGTFDLLVKNYGQVGRMSRYLDEMALGGMVSFKHIPQNVKRQAPFPYKKIGMLAGGTGIAPMIQALHAILGETDDGTSGGPTTTTTVSLIYGSRVEEEILGRELLHKWAADYPDKFTLIDVLSEEPEGSDWKGARGFPDKDLLAKYLPKPDEEDIQIFVCGPPPMYKALSGAKKDKELSGLLEEMGFTMEQVYKM
jgi:cytochrome-b5 reductase